MLTAGGSAPHLPHRTTLALLGGSILVRCRHAACAAGIAEYFSAAIVDDPWRTPDVIVDVDWEQAERYLFRARPDDHPDHELRGVRVHAHGAVAERDWPWHDPPIPPLAVEPFVGRFVALHAGAVVAPDGSALIMVGDKGSGKTTTSVDLVNAHGCSLLTDEVVFLHRRTLVVEPFPRSVGVADAYDSAVGRPVKRPRSAEAVCRSIAEQPAILRRIAFLHPQPDTASVSVERLSSDDAFRLLLANQLYAASSAAESTVTLAEIARAVPAVRVSHGGYKNLRALGGLLTAELEDAVA